MAHTNGETDLWGAGALLVVGLLVILAGVLVSVFASGSTSLICERETGYCELEKWSVLSGTDNMRFPIEDLEEARVVAQGMEHTTYGVEIVVAGRTRLLTRSGTGSRSPRVRIVDDINIFLRGEGPDTLAFQEGNSTLVIALGFALGGVGLVILAVGSLLLLRQVNLSRPGHTRHSITPADHTPASKR